MRKKPPVFASLVPQQKKAGQSFSRQKGDGRTPASQAKSVSVGDPVFIPQNSSFSILTLH